MVDQSSMISDGYRVVTRREYLSGVAAGMRGLFSLAGIFDQQSGKKGDRQRYNLRKCTVCSQLPMQVLSGDFSFPLCFFHR